VCVCVCVCLCILPSSYLLQAHSPRTLGRTECVYVSFQISPDGSGLLAESADDAPSPGVNGAADSAVKRRDSGVMIGDSGVKSGGSGVKSGSSGVVSGGSSVKSGGPGVSRNGCSASGAAVASALPPTPAKHGKPPFKQSAVSSPSVGVPWSSSAPASRVATPEAAASSSSAASGVNPSSARASNGERRASGYVLLDTNIFSYS